MRKLERVKKILSLLLCAVMVMGILPMPAQVAAQEEILPSCAHHVHDDSCGGLQNNCAYPCETCITDIQAMVDALPAVDEINGGNREQVEAALEAIDERHVLISDAAKEKIDFTKYSQAGLVLSMSKDFVQIELEKDYPDGMDGPSASFSFEDDTGTAASLIPVDSTMVTTSADPVPNGSPKIYYLPVGTYTVKETVEGEWNMTMTVNGVEQSGHTFTAEAGNDYILTVENSNTTTADVIIYTTFRDEPVANSIKIQCLDEDNNVVAEDYVDNFGKIAIEGLKAGTYTIVAEDDNETYFLEGNGKVTLTVDNDGTCSAIGMNYDDSQQGWVIPLGEYNQRTIQIYGPAGTIVSIADVSDNVIQNSQQLQMSKPSVWYPDPGTYTVKVSLPQNFHLVSGIGEWTVIVQKNGDIDTENTTLPISPYYINYLSDLHEVIKQRVTASVVWQIDENTETDLRIYLTRNGENYGDSVTLSANNNYSYTFTGLDQTTSAHEGFQDYEYSVAIDGDLPQNCQAEITGDEVNGFVITVTRSLQVISPKVSITGWTYGETANEPCITEGNAGSGAVTYTYYTDDGLTIKTSSANGAETDGGVPKYAGRYYLKAEIAETANYAGATVSTFFTIEQKQIGITWGTTEDLRYTGESLVPGAAATNLEPGDICELTAALVETTDGAGIIPGTWTVQVTGLSNSNYKLPDNAAAVFEIRNASQSKPVLAGKRESILGMQDGTITGLTTEMEYAVKENAEDNEYTSVSDSNMTFAAGTYYVRYQAKQYYDASPAAKVEIESGAKLKVNIPEAAEQVGYTIIVSEAEVGWHAQPVLTFTLLSGYRPTGGFAVKVDGTPVKLADDNTYTIPKMEEDVTVTVEGVVGQMPPDGTSLIDYKIIKGLESSYVKGSYKEISFTPNGYFDKFTGVEVDGKLIDAQYYSVESGSSIITLKSSFLETLSAGKHTIQVNYTDGNTGSENYFSVILNNGTPITGDNMNLMLMGSVAMISLLGLAALILLKKKFYQR